MTIRIAVNGAAGRMGRCLIQAVYQSEGLKLSGAIARTDSSLLGSDAGELAGVGKLGVEITSDVAAAIAQSDVIVDFTLPEVTMELIPHCLESQCRLVIGTTGFSDEQKSDAN